MSSGQQNALLCVQSVVKEHGQSITVLNASRADIKTNEYGDIVSRETSGAFDIFAFPIDLNPSDKQITKAGLHGKFDVIAHVSTLDLPVPFDELNTEQTELQIRGRQYKLTQAKEFSQYGDAFLYVVFGGKRF